MATTQYHVVFYGEIEPGHSIEDVKRNLSTRFKLNAQQLEQIFSKNPALIKANTDQQTALKYQAAFRQAGAICHLEAVEEVSDDSISKAQEQQFMICPKCGLEQEQAEGCARCGIIVKQYLKSHPEKATEYARDTGMMLCPKCGFEQKETPRCRQCGVFIKNYLKMQEKQAQKDQAEDENEYEYDEKQYNTKDFSEPSAAGRFFSKVLARLVGVAIVIAIAGLFGYCSTREKVVSSGNDRFHLTKPRGWDVETDLNEEADIQIANERKEGYFIVLSDRKLDFESYVDYKKHSALTRGYVEEFLLSYREASGPTYIMVNGMKGVQYEVTGSVDGVLVKYLHTTLEGDRYFHQLIGWSLQSMYDSNRSTFDKILNSFYES